MNYQFTKVEKHLIGNTEPKRLDGGYIWADYEPNIKYLR